jgi:hypothetical protein
MNCKDIILDLQHCDKQIKELEKESITEKKKKAAIKKIIKRAADTVENFGLEVGVNLGKGGKRGKIDLRPKTGKAAREAIKTWEAWEEYEAAGGKIPPLQEALEFLKKLKDRLQKEYKKKCLRKAWTGEVSCIIVSTNPGSFPGILGTEFVVREATYRAEHKWKISGKPEDPQGDSDTYPASWSAKESYKYVVTNNVEGGYGGNPPRETHGMQKSTYVGNGGIQQHPSPITIQIAGRNYTLSIPACHVENAVNQTITSSDAVGPMMPDYSNKMPIDVDAQSIQGVLDSSELVISGTKGPTKIGGANQWGNMTKTLTWRLTCDKEDSGLIV